MKRLEAERGGGRPRVKAGWTGCFEVGAEKYPRQDFAENQGDGTAE